MRLRRVEAVRYGDLAGAVVGEFGEALTVVFGRNEAGKSTLTSLIRHVLYGFPRGRTNERLYQPPGGDSRIGRLVFAEGSTEWLVERVEGPHGGEAGVHGPDGEVPGDSLLGPMTAGVSAAVYRSVFGFSLEELSDLGSLAEIQSRLYATTTGLQVNPHDVLERLRADAEAVWAPRARTKQLHELNARRRAIRDDRARVEELADRFRADREEREAVAIELAGVEETLRAARHHHARLSALLNDARSCDERRAEDQRTLEDQQRAIERHRRQLEDLEDVDRTIERAKEIDRLGARLELFRSESERIAQDRRRIEALDADIEQRLRELGAEWKPDEVEGLELGLELESQLHEQEEILREAKRRRDDSARQVTEARTERDAARASAEARSGELELREGVAAVDAVGARLEAVDRLLILGRQAEAQTPSAFPGVAASLVALALVVAGTVLEEPQILWAAVPPFGLAIAFFLWSWLRRRVPSEVIDLVELLGLEAQPSASELVEIKSRLEDLRRAWLAVEAAGQAADARERAAEIAESAFVKAEQQWKAWLADRRLATASGQPAAAHGVLQALRELHAQLSSRREMESEVTQRRQVCEDFIAEAMAIDDDLENAKPDDGAVARAVEAMVEGLETAREVVARRRSLSQELARLEEASESAVAGIDASVVRLREILGEAGLDDEASVADLEALEAVARQELSELESHRNELAEHRATLDGRLQRGATETASSELRLAEAGIAERIDDALESYAVRSMAVQILTEALQAFEAERQPAVIQRAQEVFTLLTDGRYRRIATPLGTFEPSVSGDGVVGRPPEKLSRSTAEQLFLALRLSYIENLAGAHEALPVLMDDVLVNFDDRRRRAAAAVIGDFASRRQVVFFTCHPRTVEAFSEEVAGCAVVDLDDPS